jgi:hypothetical protein
MMAVPGDECDRSGTLRELVRSSDTDSDVAGGRTSASRRADPSELRSRPCVGSGGDDLVPDPLPEADSAETADAWEASEAMEGQAPTG